MEREILLYYILPVASSYLMNMSTSFCDEIHFRSISKYTIKFDRMIAGIFMLYSQTNVVQVGNRENSALETITNVTEKIVLTAGGQSG